LVPFRPFENNMIIFCFGLWFQLTALTRLSLSGIWHRRAASARCRVDVLWSCYHSRKKTAKIFVSKIGVFQHLPIHSWRRRTLQNMQRIMWYWTLELHDERYMICAQPSRQTRQFRIFLKCMCITGIYFSSWLARYNLLRSLAAQENIDLISLPFNL
jgi:hypothetical protein